MEAPMSDLIRNALKTIYRPSDVVEVRAFAKDIRKVGRYPLGWDLVKALQTEEAAGADCYFVLNPTMLTPMPIGTPPNIGTKEDDVHERRWFLLDFDPKRDEKIATDAQHDTAIALARSARDFLNGEGFEGIILADSGNGGHLLVPAELPNDAESKELIRRTQRSVADKFTTEETLVECFPDAARLVRAYGTLNQKGVETETLKYRRSQVLDCK